MSRNGLFLAIEGTDGSGKYTQFEILRERLKKEGYDVASFDFPRYNEPSSFFVKEYLNGSYGGTNQVGPYTSSLFFALDRYQAAPQIRQALSEGKVVLVNRFTGSSMAHQGTKFNTAEERRGYFIWLDNLESQMLQIPRADTSLVLRVPADIAQKLVDQKEARSYTDKKRDIHEADINHLARSVEVYDDMCALFPKDFRRVDCVADGAMQSVEEISHKVWQTVEPLLPPKQATLAVSTTSAEENVTIDESNEPVFVAHGEDGELEMTAAGLKLLEGAKVNDENAQQLFNQYIVVENASNILASKLERGRLAVYLEQSTHSSLFDQKNADGRYKYHVPKHFEPIVKTEYTKRMDQIFDLYSQLVQELSGYLQQNSTLPAAKRDASWKSATHARACDTVRSVLPVAATSTIGVYASGQALESLVRRLLSDELPEARQTGRNILDEARKVTPSFLKRADDPGHGGAIVAFRSNIYQAVKELANEHLRSQHGGQPETVRLTSFWPRNEIDLLPDMLYEHSSLPLSAITDEVNNWPYERKLQVFEAYMGERLNRRQRPGRALEIAHYSWDLVCDYRIFRDLQRHRMVEDLEWQQLTPRYGYEVPTLIEEADLTEVFQACFDLSLQLYSYLQQAGYTLEAQYATLLGHKMRLKVTYNAREAFHLHELRTSPQGHPGHRKLVRQMHEQLARVHPMLAEAMVFVNKNEDPELSRLAAERYNQFKQKDL